MREAAQDLIKAARTGKVVVVLQAYCDESGIQSGAKVCSVAGWVASPRNWELFERRWRRGSGSVDFHSKEFFNRDKAGKRVGPYQHFSDRDAAAYLRGLVDAIQRSDIHAIGAVIDVEAFNRLSSHDRQWLTGAAWNTRRQRFTTTGAPSKPYYLGFIECLETAAMSVKKPGWSIDFVFDRQHELAPWALKFFHQTKNGSDSPLASKLGSAVFRSKDGVGALQAADMLASALHKHFGRMRIWPEYEPVTRALHPLVRNRISRCFASDLQRRLATLRKLQGSA